METQHRVSKCCAETTHDFTPPVSVYYKFISIYKYNNSRYQTYAVRRLESAEQRIFGVSASVRASRCN